MRKCFEPFGNSFVELIKHQPDNTNTQKPPVHFIGSITVPLSFVINDVSVLFIRNEPSSFFNNDFLTAAVMQQL